MPTITKEHVVDVCKINKGEANCGFLAYDGSDCLCVKNTSYEDDVRNRIEKGFIQNKRDNCEGRKGYVSLKAVLQEEKQMRLF